MQCSDYDEGKTDLEKIYKGNCTTMATFVLITEEYYGGEDRLKVFRKKSDAERFADTISDDIDRVVFETTLPINVNTVFVTVTEESYGGGPNKIKLFSIREEAENYGQSINGELDTVVLERVVE